MCIEKFRKYNSIELNFNPNLNVLVGENNSGKTAIIDAIRLVLGTQSNDYYKIEKEDFYYDDAQYADSFSISCYIRDFSDDEGAMFLEYMSFEEKEDNIIPYIKLEMVANRKDNRIYTDTYIGDVKGEYAQRIPGEIKDYFRVAFLKPLRDAENQMIAKKSSRLSQILSSIDVELFKDSNENELKKILDEANEKIKANTKSVKIKKIGSDEEMAIIDIINEFVNKANSGKSLLTADFKIQGNSLKEILEKLSVEFQTPKEGLGIENILYIAIELLLLRSSLKNGLRTVLIEEIEAHLHPQTQINLIDNIVKQYSESESGQIIITTHSPNITSKVDIEKIILLKGNKAFSLRQSETNLEKGDYKFLSRFLDVTKSNLFFSKNIILVEGDAENILVPAIAKIIFGDTLESKGISVINVGSTAFLRYSRIFQRKDKTDMGVKVAIITDLDIKKNEEETEEEATKREEEKKIEKEKYYNYGENIKVFISPQRTLEYCIAESELLRDELIYSMFLAKKEMNSNVNPDSEKKAEEAIREKDEFLELNKDNKNIAEEIYDNNIMKEKNHISKAIIAQILAYRLEHKDSDFKEKIKSDQYIKYIIDAIKFVGEYDDCN